MSHESDQDVHVSQAGTSSLRPLSNVCSQKTHTGLRSEPLLSSCVEEPHAFWDSLRASYTIPISQINGNIYLPTRYADIKFIVESPNLFSSCQILFGPDASPRTPSFPPFTSDPPFHAAHRALLASGLSAKNIGKFREAAERSVKLNTRRLGSRPDCELVSEYSLPFVVGAIGSLIGISDSEIDNFCDETSAHNRAARANRMNCGATAAVLEHRLRKILLDRVAEPCDDIASLLIINHRSGALQEIIPLVLLLRVLIEAGTETTAGVVSFAIKHLATGGNRSTLNHPTFSWKRAVEEFIRVASPATLARRSISASTVSGCPIANDSAVLLPFAAANRDPEIFDDPHSVKLDRHQNRHLGFGAGIHRCLGMHLARVLIEVGVKRWMESFPSYYIEGDGRIDWSIGSVRSINCLRLKL